MKGCAISAVLRGLFYVALVVAFSLVFQRLGAEASETWGASIFAGLFAWIGLTLLGGVLKPLRERRALARAIEGKPPTDGSVGVITGTIRARSAMLAPLSGASCVAFQYSIFKELTGRHSRKAVYYEGIALTPSTIRANSGTYKLLAVPTFDLESESLPHDATVRRAAEHIRTGSFEEPPKPFTRSVALEKQWSDDDGAYRREVRHAKDDPDLDTCSFSEFVVKDGAEVCVFGRYSAARGGIVADENWANETRVMAASGPTVLGALQNRCVRYVVWGVITCMVSLAIAAVFLQNTI